MIKKNKQVLWMILFSVMILMFIVLHLTPNLALKTNLFFQGYFQEAFASEVTRIEHPDKERNSTFYEVTPAPVEKETNGMLLTHKVEKVWIFYFASYYGEV